MAMYRKSRLDEALRSSAVRLLNDATLHDLLAFLTPPYIAEVSSTLPIPVSASTVRRQFADSDGVYDRRCSTPPSRLKSTTSLSTR
jgi:hypothetical protein